jgi:hypothetical protein
MADKSLGKVKVKKKWKPTQMCIRYMPLLKATDEVPETLLQGQTQLSNGKFSSCTWLSYQRKREQVI